MNNPSRTFRALGDTVNFAATTSSTSVALGVLAPEYRVYNAGTVPVFVTFGSSTVTAVTTGSMPIAGGGSVVIRPPAPTSTYIHIAGITGSSSGMVYATPGEGYT